MNNNSEVTETPKYCSNIINSAVFIISLIFSPLTLLFLIFCIIKMLKKKYITTLTTIILLIFFAEVVQCIPKFIQHLNYFFENQTIICQIQIFLSICSDYCSLVCTFLLSLKCFDTLKYRNRYFPNDKRTKTKLIIYIILGSISAGVIFYIIDLIIIKGNEDIYKTRDKCNCQCWLGHVTSIICFIFYWILIIANIAIFIGAHKFLNLKQRELYEEYELMEPNIEKVEIDDKGKNKIENECDDQDDNQKLNPQKEEKFNMNDARINRLILIKWKCTLYPIINIICWFFLVIYRSMDDITTYVLSKHESFQENLQEKEEFIESHPIFKIVIQILIIVHTISSSTRGFLFGISFIALEEKLFGNFFRKCFGKKIEAYTKFRYDNRDNKYNEEEDYEKEEYNDDEDNYENDEVSCRFSINSENMKTNTSELKAIDD